MYRLSQSSLNYPSSNQPLLALGALARWHVSPDPGQGCERKCSTSRVMVMFLFKNKILRERFIKEYIFTNEPNHLNAAIVMYNCVQAFEKLCGPIFGCKIIHLLREPQDIARSLLQKWANQAHYGNNYKSHYSVDESPPENVPFSDTEIDLLAPKIARLQTYDFPSFNP